jgi:hypothetical protein
LPAQAVDSHEQEVIAQPSHQELPAYLQEGQKDPFAVTYTASPVPFPS